MMESPPASPLEVGEAELALQFLIVALDAPAQIDGVDESRERGVLRLGREEVFGRLRLALPFDDEPFDGMGLRAGSRDGWRSLWLIFDSWSTGVAHNALI